MATEQSATSPTRDTERRFGAGAPTASAGASDVAGDPTATDFHAPEPSAAHQRRPNAGADTTPTTGTPSTSSAISVAHTGTPRTKFFVPSMGSMTHWRPASIASPPNSSPRTSSSGRSSESRARSSRSQAKSASDTGVRSGFDSTDRSAAPKRGMVTASARSASRWARARSSA